MNNQVLVKAESVSKTFCRNLKQSLWYGVRDLMCEIACRGNAHKNLRAKEFWALKDVSFEVRRGEMLGLIGANGSGKSTLLKLLNGLMKLDQGRITMRGHVQAMIELGAGFSPVLTGRENIYVNASIMGISKEKIDQSLPQIIDFSGIGGFIDSPVQNYSSGMKARLGFAVITQLDPDILLIDEVLAVGDMAFQEKCMRRMNLMRQSKKAIIFVTHSLFQVEALCDSALWIDRGSVIKYGNAKEVVRAFLDNQESIAVAESSKEGVTYEGRATTATRSYFDLKQSEKRKDGIGSATNTSEVLTIRRINLLDTNGNITREFPFLSDITVQIYYHADQRIQRPLFNLRFVHKGNYIFETSMLVDGYGPDWIEGEGLVECRIPYMPLTPKVYDIILFVRCSEGISDLVNMRSITQFRVTDERLNFIPLNGPMAINQLRQGSPIYQEHIWHFYNSTDDLISTIEARCETQDKDGRFSKR